MPALEDAFSYCKETGTITRKVTMGNYPAGSVCVSKVTGGRYLKVTYQGEVYLQHRLAWYLHFGEWPTGQVDHIDGDGCNNRISNLRESDNSTNQCNITVTRKSQTGIKGVFPVRGGKLYRAEVCLQGRRYQKHSVDPLKLEKWVREMRETLHGEFAKH